MLSGHEPAFMRGCILAIECSMTSMLPLGRLVYAVRRGGRALDVLV
jgi:hypothetical protein